MPTDRHLAGAPISWGVCEVPGWGTMLPPERVFDEMAGLGLTATELGPVDDYLPLDADAIRAMLAPRRLELLGGFVPLVLHQGDLADALDQARRVAGVMADAGASVFVLALVQDAAWSAPITLDGPGWARLAAGVDAVAEATAELGLTTVVHPHQGTLVERAAEVDVLAALSNVAWCLDPGHLALGGYDPLDFVRNYGDRIAHVHLKDVDLDDRRAPQRRRADADGRRAGRALQAAGPGRRVHRRAGRRARRAGLRRLDGPRAGLRDHRRAAGARRRTRGRRRREPALLGLAGPGGRAMSAVDPTAGAAPLRVGVIGTGRIGRLHAELLARRVAGAHVAMVCDAHVPSALAAAVDLGVPAVDSAAELIGSAEVDAVAICTSTDTHVDLILAAAAAGKAIFCEKPVSLDLEAVDAALRCGRDRRPDLPDRLQPAL